MTNSLKEFLSHFGWDDFFKSQLTSDFDHNLFPVRVIGEERGIYHLQLDTGKNCWSSISGKMQFRANGRQDFPVIGDWVLAEKADFSERATIHYVLKRKSTLQRKQASGVQILSANVNYVFITTSLNGDLNFSRLDRYVVFAWDSGATPIILLTKADLYSENLPELINKVEERFPGVPVHTLSMENFAQADFFSLYLKKGTTTVLVGSSGVGKSTLANFLVGQDVLKTQGIREDDDKGRHTTTSRALYETIFGGLIIDTPGMRGLQFSADEESFNKQFYDVEELKMSCRFSDCRHLTEPECEIRKALEEGRLEPERWKNYCKLLAEVKFSMRKKDKILHAEDRKIWKKQSLISRRNSKFTKCYKGEM